MSNTFGERLRVLMEARQMTVIGLAYALEQINAGVSQATIQNWLTDANLPKASMIQYLVCVLDCNYIDLLGDERGTSVFTQ